MNKLRSVVVLAALSCAGCSEEGAQTGREQELQKMIATIDRNIQEHKAKGRDFSELDMLKGQLEQELTRLRK